MRVKWNTHILQKFANSITATRMTGSVMERNTSAMITKIATMEIALTTLKSVSVMVIRSLVHGASPISMPFSHKPLQCR